MRVLVCGGRDYQEKDFVFFVLDLLEAKKHIDLVIHGCASGADTYAAEWSEQNANCTSFGVPAEWKLYGNNAGPIRNRRMLSLGKPDLVVAFPGGKGTADMVKAAEEDGVRVLEASKLKGDFESLRAGFV